MTIAEFWKERYDAVVVEKQILVADRKELKAEIEELRQQIDDLKDSGLTYAALKNMETEKKDLQTRLNNSRASNESYRSMNSYLSRKLSSSMHQAQELKMQLEAEKKENESLHNVIDSFVDKCKELEDKAEGYKKKLELLNTVVTPDLDAQLKSMTERLDKSIADRKELQADRDIWFRKNGEKQAEIEELKKKIQSLEDDIEFKALCRDGWRDRAEKAERQLEEKKQQSYSDGYSDGNEEGQNELWEMLQLINDVKPFKAPYFEDVTSMNDIISWDLEDFKEAYGKWEAEKKKAAEEEHKLEYGDAVRLPWCDYDYMYIAPDEKEETLVRLFDPNIHAIVTTHISNVRYNGGRILVSEEDDIRKIWKYMK